MKMYLKQLSIFCLYKRKNETLLTCSTLCKYCSITHQSPTVYIRLGVLENREKHFRIRFIRLEVSGDLSRQGTRKNDKFSSNYIELADLSDESRFFRAPIFASKVEKRLVRDFKRFITRTDVGVFVKNVAARLHKELFRLVEN
jgi:hypothetical protein